ncbi:hypothetical protein DL767_007021 [Monosporascus sp. MG133]|nr:hypothetical protein DL767_007021 [Monosporascus sp. MG133]
MSEGGNDFNVLRTEIRKLGGQGEGDMLFEERFLSRRPRRSVLLVGICMMCETVEGGSKRKRRDAEYLKSRRRESEMLHKYPR